MATSGLQALPLANPAITRENPPKAAGNPAVFLVFRPQINSHNPYHHHNNHKEGDEVMGPLVDTIEQLRQNEAAWEAHAACRSVTNAGELFFSEDIGDIAAAKRVCAECPVLAPCLEGALERREPWGVWGGQLFMNGKMLMVKRRRGRPPKIARPEDQMPVVPVPAHLAEQAQRRTA